MAEETSITTKSQVSDDPYQQKLLGILGSQLFDVFVNTDNSPNSPNSPLRTAYDSSKMDCNPNETFQPRAKNKIHLNMAATSTDSDSKSQTSSLDTAMNINHTSSTSTVSVESLQDSSNGTPSEKMAISISISSDNKQSERNKEIKALIYENHDDKKEDDAPSKIKYFEIMKDINIFNNINDVLKIADFGSAQSDETDLESVVHSSINSPFTPYSPYPQNGSQCDKIDFSHLIQKHLLQNRKSKDLAKDRVYFDRCLYNADNNKIVMISSKGFSTGMHEWMIEIKKCGIYQQEIGVVSFDVNKKIEIKSDGIRATKKFGARAVYGNELWTDTIYYGSWNSNGKKRCYRDLKDKHHVAWGTGDVIKVCVDLNAWNIKFWLNGVRVRKSLSLEPGKTYYPVIGFSGDCVYNVVSLL